MLYARWTANTYDVYLIGNGGTHSNGTTLTNLVTNGGFENGSNGWSLSGASITTEKNIQEIVH